jgi:hypothetical protein
MPPVAFSASKWALAARADSGNMLSPSSALAAPTLIGLAAGGAPAPQPARANHAAENC